MVFLQDLATNAQMAKQWNALLAQLDASTAPAEEKAQAVENFVGRPVGDVVEVDPEAPEQRLLDELADELERSPDPAWPTPEEPQRPVDTDPEEDPDDDFPDDEPIDTLGNR